MSQQDGGIVVAGLKDDKAVRISIDGIRPTQEVLDTLLKEIEKHGNTDTPAN